MMKTSEVLIKARKLIEEEENWVQGCFARNSKDEVVNPRSQAAKKFCALGAISHVSQTDIYSAENARSALVEGVSPLFCGSVSTFNDENSHDEIINLFDAAILKMKETGE